MMTGQFDDITEAIQSLNVSNQSIHEMASEISESSRQVTEQVDESEGHAKELRESTEKMQMILVRMKTGGTVFDGICAKAEEFRDHATEILSRLSERGVNVFDQNYRLIPGSNSKRFETTYDRQCEPELQRFHNSFIKANPGIVY